MRQITEQSVNAFLNRKTFSKSNTTVAKLGDKYYLSLFGNIIAVLHNDNTLMITNAGWQSNTTKDRLNALPNVNIQQKNFVWYLNGNEWNGDWIDVTNNNLKK